MYNVVKIQLKTVYIKCTDGLNACKHSNLLNVRYRENLMENCVH